MLTAMLARHAATAMGIRTCWPWETAATLPSAQPREAFRHQWGKRRAAGAYRGGIPTYSLFILTASVGRIVFGVNRLWGESSVGRDVHGAKRLWGEMSFHGAKCPWGEMSVGRKVHKPVLFAFILLYFFGFTFTAAPASLTVVRKRTDYTRNKSSRECKFPRTFVHRSESSRVLSFLGAKVPTGNFRWLRSENTGERKVLIPFTDVCLSLQQIVLVHMKRIQKLFCSIVISVRPSRYRCHW